MPVFVLGATARARLDATGNRGTAGVLGSPGREPTAEARALVGLETDLPIYLDYQATTPLDPRVRAAMEPFMGDAFGNPHSVTHAYGWRAREAVDQARRRVADLIGSAPDEIVFTSGATEANNLAIQGVLAARAPGRRHVVSCAIEHKSVLAPLQAASRDGAEVVFLPVDRAGLVEVGALARTLRPDTALVTVMAVNNEIGVIQPIEEIGALCAAQGVPFHTDAAQAAVRIPLNMGRQGLALASLSAHKLYGPMGVGALYVRRRPPVPIEPIFRGGGQEMGLRSGTLPLALCVGFGRACELAAEYMREDTERIADLARRLFGSVTQRLDGVGLNGDPQRRVPHNLNLRFDGVEGQDLLAELQTKIAVATGSACTSELQEASHVLKALGLSDGDADASIRVSLGRFTTEAEVDRAVDAIVGAVEGLRGAR